MRIVAVRADGSPCGPDEIGEICLSGENVCGGYWKNPEETKRFEAEIPGYPGRFYRTGDMGALYDGQLYLTGRIKEMIVVSGKNIYPSDITLLLHEQGLAPAVDAAGALHGMRRGGGLPFPRGRDQPRRGRVVRVLLPRHGVCGGGLPPAHRQPQDQDPRHQGGV